DRFFEALAQFHRFGGRLRLGGGLREHGGDEPVARPEGAQLPEQRRADPQEDDDGDGNQPRELRFERPVGSERKVRPGVPDEDRDEQEADQAEERAAFEHCEHGMAFRPRARGRFPRAGCVTGSPEWTRDGTAARTSRRRSSSTWRRCRSTPAGPSPRSGRARATARNYPGIAAI